MPIRTNVYDDTNYALRIHGQPATVEQLASEMRLARGRCYEIAAIQNVLDTLVQYGTLLKHGSFYSIANDAVVGGRFCRQSFSFHQHTRRALYPWR